MVNLEIRTSIVSKHYFLIMKGKKLAYWDVGWCGKGWVTRNRQALLVGIITGIPKRISRETQKSLEKASRELQECSNGSVKIASKESQENRKRSSR